METRNDSLHFNSISFLKLKGLHQASRFLKDELWQAYFSVRWCPFRNWKYCPWEEKHVRRWERMQDDVINYLHDEIANNIIN